VETFTVHEVELGTKRYTEEMEEEVVEGEIKCCHGVDLWKEWQIVDNQNIGCIGHLVGEVGEGSV
jgi:hypothetical protein